MHNQSTDQRSSSYYSIQINKRGERPKRPAFTPTPEGCLLWNGATNSKGYGMRGDKLVHREAWEQIVGEIPVGHDIHHKCRNTLCANVDHLETIPHDEHARLSIHTSRLDRLSVLSILTLATSGVSDKDIAAQFGLSRSQIGKIRRGQVWKPIYLAFLEREVETHLWPVQ